MLALSVEYGLKRQLDDVKNGFVHAPLSEEIYIEQPLRFKDKRHERKVSRLNKALYGLKQA